MSGFALSVVLLVVSADVDGVPSEGLEHPALKAPWSVWIAADGEVGFQRPSLSGENVHTFKFMDQAHLLKAHPDDKRPSAYLVGLADRETRAVKKAFGWVDARMVVTRPRPLSQTVTVNGVPMTSKFLHRKGMVVLRREQVATLRAQLSKLNRAAGEEVELKHVPIYSSPKNVTRKVKLVSLSEFYFVYGETPEYVLVGPTETFQPTRPNLLGWMQKTYHTPWNSRVGIEWNWPNFAAKETIARQILKKQEELRKSDPQRELGVRIEKMKTFKFITDAKRSLNGDAVGALSEERLDEKRLGENGEPIYSRPWTDSDPRWPFLETVPLNEKPEEPNQLMRVGIWLKGGPSLGELRRSLIRLLGQIQNLEVIVAIDHTVSMEDAFPRVRDAVQQVIDGLRQKYREIQSAVGQERLPFTLSVAISYYGDEQTDAKCVSRQLSKVSYAPSRTSYSDDEIKNAASQTRGLSVDLMIAELGKHGPRGGGGIEEDVFIGIAKAAGQFTENQGRKLLIVVGDMGDKADGKRLTDLEKYAANELAKRGRLASPVRVVVLQVPIDNPRNEEAPKVAAERFHDQMSSLIRRMDGYAKERLGIPDYTATSQIYRLAKFGDVTNRVKTELDEEIEEARELLKRIRDFERESIPYSDLTPQEKAFLKKGGVEGDFVRPLYREAFLWRNARIDSTFPEEYRIEPWRGLVEVPQIRSRVLISKPDLQSIANILKNFVEKAAVAGGDVGLGDILRKEIESVFGEKTTAGFASPAEAIQELMGIPFTTKLFDRDWNLLKLSNEEIADLKIHYHKIEDILNKVEHTYTKTSDQFGNFTIKASNRRIVPDRSFPREADKKGIYYYWLRESDLP